MTEAAERQGALSWDSIPRRVVTVYVPLVLFIVVLLFPFYWMAVTTFKPNNELYDYKDDNPFWVHSPTLQNVRKLLWDTDYPQWLMTTMGIAAAATAISIVASVLAATPSGACVSAATNGWGCRSTWPT